MIASLPSPTVGVWHLGPFPLRMYAVCILLGIVVAVWWTQKRLEARGGQPGQVLDVAMWAVPLGIIGGRLYHVISSYQPYFGPGGNPLDGIGLEETQRALAADLGYTSSGGRQHQELTRQVTGFAVSTFHMAEWGPEDDEGGRPSLVRLHKAAGRMCGAAGRRGGGPVRARDTSGS